MARKNNRLAQLARERQEMEMTPMIDVTFLLLVFFMCTLKFKVLEGKLGAALPRDVGHSEMPPEAIETFHVQLRVAEPGTKLRVDRRTGQLAPITENEATDGRRFQFGDDRVIEYTMGSFATTDLREVRTRLRLVQSLAVDAGETSARVEIDPRAATIQQDVVRLLDEVIGAGITEVSFSRPPSR